MSITIKDVSVVIPTRGDQDLTEILASLPFGEVVVWDNSVQPDLKVYARYAAIGATTRPVILTQDDDCVLGPDVWAALLDAYEPGTVTANMSAYHQLHTRENVMVGFGAVFDRDLPAAAFARYPGFDLTDPVFLRCCDIVFTALTPRRCVDVPFRYLPWSSTPERMWKQPGFAVERESVLNTVLEVARTEK
jgi:hypothetical protein